MKLTIELDCSNAAFGEGDHEAGQEIARILREAAGRLETYGAHGLRLRDVNGNIVGGLDIEPRQPAA